MHKINKGVPCQDFVSFNREKHAKWEEAVGHIHDWRDYIIQNEQDGCSGYTEVPITVDDSHIDHFRKQALFNDYIFRWENFVADSNDEDYGAKFKDKTICTKEENLMLINPAEEDAENFFYYEATGEIVPAQGLTQQDADRARFTIDTFNLNEASLKERRKCILNQNLECYSDFEKEEIQKALSCNGFISVARQATDELFEIMEEKKK